MVPSLSICIPAYRRIFHIAQHLEAFRQAPFINGLSLHIILDGDCQEIYDLIAHAQRNSGDYLNTLLFHSLPHRGLASTFSAFFQLNSSEYKLFVADDDIIYYDEISKFIAYLADNPTHSSIISCDWLSQPPSQKRIRSWPPHKTQLSYSAVRHALDHLPGNVFPKGIVSSRAFDHFSLLHQEGHYLATVFPQVVLVLLAIGIDSYNLISLPFAVGGYSHSGPSPSDLRGYGGDHWSSPESRVLEYLSLLRLLEYLAKYISPSNLHYPEFSAFRRKLISRCLPFLYDQTVRVTGLRLIPFLRSCILLFLSASRRFMLNHN